MPMQPAPDTLADNLPQNATITDTLFSLTLFGGTVPFISYPTPNPPLLPSNQSVYIFPTNPRDPYSTNWLFGVQQELAPGTVLTLTTPATRCSTLRPASPSRELISIPRIQTQTLTGGWLHREFPTRTRTTCPTVFSRITTPCRRSSAGTLERSPSKRTTPSLTRSTMRLTCLRDFRTHSIPTLTAEAGIGTRGTTSLPARSTAYLT